MEKNKNCYGKFGFKKIVIYFRTALHECQIDTLTAGGDIHPVSFIFLDLSYSMQT
jgi:hypothetical protein